MLDVFSIDWVDRSKNIMAEFLLNIALRQNDLTLAGITEVKIKARPSVLDNVYHW